MKKRHMGVVGWLAAVAWVATVFVLVSRITA